MNDTTWDIRRKPKDAPWCWQHKEALRIIRDVFEATGHAAFGLAVYVALSELASDSQSERFSAPISEIAKRAGLSYKTAAKILNRLECLELIDVQRNSVPGTKEHAPSTYTMLGTSEPTLRTEAKSAVPRRLKNPKNPLSSGETHVSVKNQHLLVDEDGLLTEEQRAAIDFYNAKLVPKGWSRVTKISPAIQRVIQTFDAASIRELVDTTFEDSSEMWPKRRTLVRLLWHNY